MSSSSYSSPLPFVHREPARFVSLSFFRCEIPYFYPIRRDFEILFHQAFFTQRELKSGTMVSTDFPAEWSKGRWKINTNEIHRFMVLLTSRIDMLARLLCRTLFSVCKLCPSHKCDRCRGEKSMMIVMNRSCGLLRNHLIIKTFRALYLHTACSLFRERLSIIALSSLNNFHRPTNGGFVLMLIKNLARLSWPVLIKVY